MSLVTVSCVDPTIGLSKRAKYFVICTGSMDLNTRRIYLRDVVRGRFEAPEQPKVITRVYQDWQPLFVGIEETMWQTSLIQYLRREGVVPTKPIDRRKQHNANTGVRAMALAARYEAGMVYHPSDPKPSWLDAFEKELLAFTGDDSRDEYTDQVSAWADVVQELVSIGSYYNQQRTEPQYGEFSWEAPSAYELDLVG